MPTVYNDPIMLDSTGQDIVTKLDNIATLMGDGVIDDTSTATDTTWSSNKITSELSNKVSKSSSAGVLNNDGSVRGIDNFPQEDSTNLVTSGGVRAATDEIYGTIAPIESGLQSENAYAVGEHFLSADGFCTAIQPIAIGDTLTKNVNYVEGTIGTAITESNNGIIANTKLIKDTVGWSGKNLLKSTASTTMIANTTFTVNADKSITGNSTAAGVADLQIYKGNDIPIGDYILSKGDVTLPSGSAFYVNAFNGDTYVKSIKQISGSEGEKPFTIDYDGYDNIKVGWFNNNIALSNVTIYPMIRKADILDNTYEPYRVSVNDTLRDAEVIEGKNLLEQNYVSITNKGITFNVKSDKTIEVYGTATDTVNFLLHTCDGKEEYLGKRVTLSGCPSGGSGSTYFINAYRIASQDGSTGTIYDTGTSQTFDFLNDASGTVGSISIAVTSGTNMGTQGNPKVFKPMIRLATETDPTYEPYYIPLKDSMFPRSEQAVLGAKNIMLNNAISKEENGITFTVNSNGSITINGTSTADTTIVIAKRDDNFAPPNGRYTFSKGVTTDGIEMFVNKFNNDTYIETLGVTSSVTEKTFDIDYNNYTKLVIGISVKANKTIDNVTIYPMARIATDPDDTYVPYAMTNKELTENKVDKTGTILNSSNDLDDILESGYYSWENTYPLHAPETKGFGTMHVFGTNERKVQIVHIIMSDACFVYMRRYAANSWGSWYKFTGTVVS